MDTQKAKVFRKPVFPNRHWFGCKLVFTIHLVSFVPLTQRLKDEPMKCPTCPDIALVMTDRQGVEIDYCPQCRGVWLDRGELDKLIERAAVAPAAPPAMGNTRSRPDFSDSDYGQSRGHHPKRQKSWLSEIFD